MAISIRRRSTHALRAREIEGQQDHQPCCATQQRAAPSGGHTPPRCANRVTVRAVHLPFASATAAMRALPPLLLCARRRWQDTCTVSSMQHTWQPECRGIDIFTAGSHGRCLESIQAEACPSAAAATAAAAVARRRRQLGRRCDRRLRRRSHAVPSGHNQDAATGNALWRRHPRSHQGRRRQSSVRRPWVRAHPRFWFSDPLVVKNWGRTHPCGWVRFAQPWLSLLSRRMHQRNFRTTLHDPESIPGHAILSTRARFCGAAWSSLSSSWCWCHAKPLESVFWYLLNLRFVIPAEPVF